MRADIESRGLVWSERAGNVSVLRMNDPDRSNRLTPAMVTELTGALSSFEGLALVVCSTGRNFCSGGDHDSFLRMSVDERRQHLADIKALLTEVRQVPVPTVACMQGAVVGGGLELALQCDLLVAADDARFQLPHVATKSKLRRESYSTLVARTGLGFARRMSLLGDAVPAPAAFAAGLVDFLVRRSDLFAVATSIAGDLAGQPQESLRHAREALAQPRYLEADRTSGSHGRPKAG